MGMGLLIVWALLGIWFMWENREVIDNLPVWRGLLIAVILCLCAPVFFVSDGAELLLDIIAGEDEDE